MTAVLQYEGNIIKCTVYVHIHTTEHLQKMSILM